MLSEYVHFAHLIICYSPPLQADRNPLLDVARASYKENVHDIFDLGKATQEKYDVPVELVYMQEGGGGFCFSLPRSVTEEEDWEWPQEWIDKSLKRKKWIFSSLDLVRGAGRCSCPIR
jgi:DNA mismatch repair protein MSH4